MWQMLCTAAHHSTRYVECRGYADESWVCTFFVENEYWPNVYLFLQYLSRKIQNDSLFQTESTYQLSSTHVTLFWTCTTHANITQIFIMSPTNIRDTYYPTNLMCLYESTIKKAWTLINKGTSMGVYISVWKIMWKLGFGSSIRVLRYSISIWVPEYM